MKETGIIIREWPAEISGDPASGGIGPFDMRGMGGPCHVIGAVVHMFNEGETVACWLAVDDDGKIRTVAMSRVRVTSWLKDQP